MEKVITVTYVDTYNDPYEVITYNIPYDEKWYQRLLKANGRDVNSININDEQTETILEFCEMVSEEDAEWFGGESQLHVPEELVGSWFKYRAMPNTPFTSVGVIHIGFIC